MSSLVDKVLQENSKQCGFDESMNTPSIKRILQHSKEYTYSGFDAVCATSSGNPQNLLQLCSSIFATNAIIKHATRGLVYSPKAQDDAIRAWSQEYEDRNPDAISRTFCRALLRKVRQNPIDSKTIGFTYTHQEGDLFTEDYMPLEEGEKIRAAFSTGFLRRSSKRSNSIFEVPSQFHLSRGLLPREEIELSIDISPSLSIDQKFISQNARDNIITSQRTNSKRSTSYKAFLSTSFAPLLQQQRSDIKHHLQKVNIDCKDLEDTPGDQFLYSSVLKMISWCDFCILDATKLRPYTMVELGLCAGSTNPKGIICIVNDDGMENPIDNILEPLRKLHILAYDFSPERLQKLAASVYNRADEIIGSPSEFVKVTLTGVPLRSRKRSNTLYVSIAPSKSYKTDLETRLRSALDDIGWSMVTEDDFNTYGTNEIQIAIQAAYMTKIGVIDTTGVNEPNLFQCFKLGLFANKRSPWRLMRVEQVGHSHADSLSSIPQFAPTIWDEYDRLVQQVIDFVSK